MDFLSKLCKYSYVSRNLSPSLSIFQQRKKEEFSLINIVVGIHHSRRRHRHHILGLFMCTLPTYLPTYTNYDVVEEFSFS